MNFITYKQLVEDCNAFAERLKDFDVIVGVARSGILPAMLIAQRLNKRFGVYDGQISILNGGDRDTGRTNKIVILDDSIDTGNTYETIRRKYNYQFVALYTNEEKGGIITHRVVPQPRMFEWNYMNHGMLRNSCLDIDGVINRDCRRDEEYDEFFRTVTPWYIPKVEIHSFVTGRLESSRQVTEDYLKKYGIKYKNLYMRPSKDIDCEDFKADIYKKSNCDLFIESSVFQAEKIAQLTKRPVLCTETLTVF